MTEMVFQASRAMPGEPILSKWWRSVDRWSFFSILALFAIGLLLGFAASPPLAEKNGLGHFYYVSRQAVFGFFALGVMFTVSMISPTRLRRWSVMGFGLVFLSILLLPVLGTDFGKGATRWYSLGFISVQPSEFLKPVFVMFCAWLLAASQDISGPPGRLLSFGVTVITALLLALQPDFGQATLILCSWAVMYFVAGAPYKQLVFLVVSVAAVGNFAYNNSQHVANRINAFLSGDIDPRTQIGYATNAIQEGGLLGVGVGEGSVKWSLPDAHTDFIIAVAAEEYGLVLVAILIALFLTVTLRSLSRLLNERDPFIRFAGTGLACLFGAQALINMGVAVRLLPAKGMTLPFVSYGGSSIVAAGLLAGFLLALTRERPRETFADILEKDRDY